MLVRIGSDHGLIAEMGKSSEIAFVLFVVCMRSQETTCSFNVKTQGCYGGIRFQCNSWDLEVAAMLQRTRGNSFEVRVGRLTSAAVVYIIWQERNQRIFQNKFRTENGVLRILKGMFKLRLGIGIGIVGM